MKTRAILLFFFVALILGCEKSKYESAGTIMGADMTMCACCGGYFIEINGATYHFNKTELPSDFTFTDEQLPLKVDLDWKNNSAVCSGSGINWIKISKIKLAQ
jgi:hypothetical protein